MGNPLVYSQVVDLRRGVTALDVATPPAEPPAEPPDLLTGLVAYWKLDEASGNRADSVGANTLTDNNTVTSTTGKVGSAADFEVDNSESLSISDNAVLSMGNIDFTLAGWVMLDTKTAIRAVIAKYTTVGNQREYMVRYESATDRFVFRVSADGVNNTAVSADNLGSPSTDAWYFIVAWHDAAADTINIQVNNGAANSTAHATGVLDGTSVFYLGSREGTDFFDGLIDETGLWKRALTAAERAYLYNGGAGRTYPFT